MLDEIVIKGARENNLKNISLSIPKNKLVVLTGLSGSGKSSLAYDTLQKECMRQYMESLGMVTDFVSKPRFDSISGLSPSISVDQHLLNHNPRSTVGTLTEVYTYLRVLYARIGERPCPSCGEMVKPDGMYADNGNDALGNDEAPPEEEFFPCPRCGRPVPQMSMANFSFNKPDGACPACTGLGSTYQANLRLLVDNEKSIAGGAVYSWEDNLINYYTQTFREAGRHYGFEIDFSVPVGQLEQAARDYLFYGVESTEFKRHFPDKEPPVYASKGRFEGLATNVLRKHAQRADDAKYREKVEKFLIQRKCPECGGARLKKGSRDVRIMGKNIVELSALSFEELHLWLGEIENNLSENERVVSEPIMADLRARIARLIDAGVAYLSMEREAATLSGGEAQRLRLASLLGSGLTGVLYVLDEPTTGLHPRDAEKLIKVLKKLRDLGNTVLVIEHDLDVIRQADHIIDMGPGAGREGGSIIVQGTVRQVMECEESATGKYLAKCSEVAKLPETSNCRQYLIISGAREHNLKNIDVNLPLGVFGVISGVSGSGKSSLMFDIVDRAGRRLFYGSSDEPGMHDRITGWENISRLVTVDQSRIGRISRSNVATYTDLFTPIRSLFAGLEKSKSGRLDPRHFSFNVPGGRCERCEGAGALNIDMHFLPDVQVVCPACRGKRFKKEILDVRFNGLNISEVLNLTVKEARNVFADEKEIMRKLDVLTEVGLGYLALGQSAETLSGGEAQRIKLSKELGRGGKGGTLYILDEPTNGLHAQDAEKLAGLLRRLVSQGNTVYVVEHNTEIIKNADFVLDLGPEGGDGGGFIVAQGTPYEVSKSEQSYTGRFLRNGA